MSENLLIGCTLIGVTLSDDQHQIIFITEKGALPATCYEECCSHTWINDVEMPARQLGGLITNINWLDLSHRNESSDDSLIQHYGFELYTTHGILTVEFRNKSNGYYGGSLDFASAFTPHEKAVKYLKPPYKVLG